jgi:hypothetical protein
VTAHYEGARKLTRVERFIPDYFDEWHRMAKAAAKRKPDEKPDGVFDPDADAAEAWEQWLGFAQDVLDETHLHEPAKRSTDDGD